MYLYPDPDLHLCCIIPGAGILICMVRDLLPKRAAKWVPSPMAMSIPFYIGAASVGTWLNLNVHTGIQLLQRGLLALTRLFVQFGLPMGGTCSVFAC